MNTAILSVKGATAQRHGLTSALRNTGDFEGFSNCVAEPLCVNKKAPSQNKSAWGLNELLAFKRLFLQNRA
jgi:hypothetical protein